MDSKSIHDGVKIKSIKINEYVVDISTMTYYSTILVFPVPDKIHPVSKTKIEIEWQEMMHLVPCAE